MTHKPAAKLRIILGCMFASSTRAQICLESQQQIPAGNGGTRVRPSRDRGEPRIPTIFGGRTEGRKR